MNTREIITLQFGHYSNFVGAHWWNIQELDFQYTESGTASEINHNVLYREGQTPKGEVTFTPRLLLVDLKGSLKSLPEEGELYDAPTDPSSIQVPWHGNVEVKEDSKEPKNEYQTNLDNTSGTASSNNKKYDLDSTVNVWSDYLYARFHPRTVNVIKEYSHGNADVGFDVFPLGVNLWKTEHFQEDFNDNIRHFVEECHNFQGFQVLTDATDAFSGLSYSCIETLRDDYERKTVFALPLLPSYYEDYAYETDEEQRSSHMKDCVRVLNLAFGFEKFAEHSSLFVPLSTSKNGWRRPEPQREFHHLNYNDTLPYHTGAILASALDTFSLKYRLNSTSYSLSDLCVDLSLHGRKVGAASLCLPFSFNTGADFIDCLNNWDGPLAQSITPNCSIGTDRVMQMVTLRGIPENRLKRPLESAGVQRAMAPYNCNSVNDMLQFYLSCNTSGTKSNTTTITKGLNVSSPYPDVFDSHVGVDGNIVSNPRLQQTRVQSVPVLSGLHSGKENGDMLESLHAQAQKLKFRRFHQFISAGLEVDDFTQCLDKLLDLRDCYTDTYLV